MNIITINKNNVRLENKNNVTDYPLSDYVYRNGELEDSTSIIYILSKIRKRLNKRDKVIVRYNNELNKLRVIEVHNLNENEIKSYINLNSESILPKNQEIDSFVYEYDGYYLVLGYIDLNVRKIVNESFKDFKNIYLTGFPYEVIACYNTLHYNNFIYLNLENNFIEYMLFNEGEFINYRHLNLLNCIDKNNFNINDNKNKIIISEIKANIKGIFNSIKDFDQYKIYCIGDKSIIGIYNQIFDGNIFEYRDFVLEEYF